MNEMTTRPCKGFISSARGTLVEPDLITVWNVAGYRHVKGFHHDLLVHLFLIYTLIQTAADRCLLINSSL